MKVSVRICLGIVVVFALAWIACEKRYEYKLPGAANYPGWVYKGSGALKEGEKQLLVGVGSVSGIKNLPLAKTTAANRARMSACIAA